MPGIGIGVRIYNAFANLHLKNATDLAVSFNVDTINANLTWTDNTRGIAKYEIYSNTNGGGYILLCTTPAGATSYNDPTCKQNANVAYRIRAKKGFVYSDYSTFETLSTPLCWKTDQTVRTSLNINSLKIATGKSVTIDWGDGTSDVYTGDNVFTKTYATSEIDIFNIAMSGDLNYITEFQHITQVKSYGDITNWTMPSSMVFFNIQSTSFTGDVTDWVLPSTMTTLSIRTTALTGNITNWVMPVIMTIFNISTTNIYGVAPQISVNATEAMIYRAYLTYITGINTSNFRKAMTEYNIHDVYSTIYSSDVDQFFKDAADFYEINAPTANCLFNLKGTNIGIPTDGALNADIVRLKQYYVNAGKLATVTISSLQLETDDTLVGSASSSYVDGSITYPSSIDDISNLYAVTSYDSGFTDNLPIACFGHGFSGDANTITLSQMHEYAAVGFFVLNIGMRGRNSASGSKDCSGREIHDIYDAIEYIRANYPIVSPTKVIWVGFSGGGGNGMNLGSKFPDLCTLLVSHWGMSDYGEDETTGWYAQAASSYKTAMEAQIGGNPSIYPWRYASRNARRALWKNFIGGIAYLYHGSSDTVVPSSQSQLMYNEFVDNGKTNCIMDINSYSHVNYDGSTLSNFSASALSNRGWIAPIVGEMVIIGYLKTKTFFVMLGNGADHVAEIKYNTNLKLFTITPISGEMSVSIRFDSVTQTETIDSETVFDFN